MKNKTKVKRGEVSRRDFMKASAAVSLGALGAGASKVFASGSDRIRVGLIGCGDRGRYDTTNCLKSSENVELVAMGDVFGDHIDKCLADLSRTVDDKVSVSKDMSFVGIEAYKKVLACDLDMVILTTPPHFRPEHLKAAVEAGKHIFTEKPVAVDPVGVRSVIATSESAEEKNLTIVVGTQMRRIAHLVAAMERIHNGDIGDILAGWCVRIGDGMPNWGPKIRQHSWSDMEWQLRRWLFFTWLSGDLIVEQHIHNLDIINWALGSHPEKCMGMGGREVRIGPEYGNVYDHFSVEYEYPNGVRVSYMGAQIDGCSVRCDQRLVGTRGSAYLDFGNAVIKGEKAFTYEGAIPDPCIQQHADQIAAIRDGKRLNEGRRIAESTLTAIMGRMSAYTGRALSWDWVMKTSKLDLRPPSYEFGDMSVRPVAVPGKTELV
ncbi:MAG: Gfo/Idh/MocA family oxidoreductase [Planctomycetota bacterium]|nr:MAG: Gfo/Idh/MocA family oxidoreductase [Planctomycetota bacterium]